MKKTLLTIVLALSFTLTACGNSSEKAVKEAYKEMGLEDEEINELMSELDDEDLDELAQIQAEIEEMDSASESNTEETEAEPVQELSFTMSDTIKNANLSDGIIQIYDMIFPIDGSITIGDAIKILEGSSLDLEYDIPKDGMVSSSESYSVTLDGNTLINLYAEKISDKNYDAPYDCMLSNIGFGSELLKEYIWYPNGITLGVDVDDLESMLKANNLTNDEDSTKYHYTWGNDSFSATVPAKNNTLKDTRYDLQYHFTIDSSNKAVDSISLSTKDTNMKDYAMALGYLNNAKAITSTAEITDAVIAKLDEFDDVYIGQDLKFVFSETKPTSSDLYGIIFDKNGLTYIMSKCDTEEDGIQYVETLLAPIYVTDSGEVFVSYNSDDPTISFDAGYYKKFNGDYDIGDCLVIE